MLTPRVHTVWVVVLWTPASCWGTIWPFSSFFLLYRKAASTCIVSTSETRSSLLPGFCGTGSVVILLSTQLVGDRITLPVSLIPKRQGSVAHSL